MAKQNVTKDMAELLLNKENLEKSLEKYANRLIGFINSFVNDTNIAEDIMMDTFVDLLKNKPKIENESSLISYLFVCAKNKSLNYIKKNKRLTPLTEEILKDTYELDNLLYDTHTKKMIHNTMLKLNSRYKTILYLSFFEDLSSAEIEQILELNNKQVRNLKHRAIKKMNKLLREQNFFYSEEE